MQGAFICVDDGWHLLIRHRQNARFHIKGGPDGLRGIGKGLALGEHRGAMDVRSKISIAEIKPIDSAEDGEALERVKCLASKTPPLCRIDNPSERVGNDVEIG